MGSLILLTLMLGCGLVSRVEGFVFHTRPLEPGVSVGMTAGQGLVLRYSRLEHGNSSTWEVFDDGRVRYENRQHKWEERTPLDSDELEALKAKLVEMDLQGAKGQHLPDNPADDMGRRVIFVPYLGPDVALFANADHRCETIDFFFDEVLGLFSTPALGSAEPAPDTR